MGIELLHKDITDKIIGAFFEVYKTLGYGFLEKVYENAKMIELKEKGLSCDEQSKIQVKYKDQNVGVYCADIIVNSLVIVEIKACENLIEEHEFQLINYLKSTNIEVGLLLNFGKKPEFKRKVFTNNK